MESIPLAVNNEPFVEAKAGGYEWDAPQLFTDDVTFSKPVLSVVYTVAAAGTNAATATLISPLYGFVTVTAADATKGVIVGAIPIGATLSGYNVAAAVLKVYPPTGGNFNGGSTDAIISVAAKVPFSIKNVDGTLYVATYT